MSTGLIIVGSLIVLEALTALEWAYNDKGIVPQLIRAGRLLMGIFVIVAGILIEG